MFRYRLDGIVTGVQIYTGRSEAKPSVCSEDTLSRHLTDLNHMTLQLHACISWESWPDSRNMFCCYMYSI